MASWQPYRALYIHVPFCKSRCRYCDFSTRAVACDDPCLDAYTDALIQEIRNYSRKDMLGNIETVYLVTNAFLLSFMLYRFRCI